ncbi:MAG: endopeptidase La [Candidatus Cloacimonetes bacterium]|nr:endopeptidase La [Candidatus Cloacimonadota bacterium]MBS3766714.1 endopeptidase La [Candidatus Cloacimonadota bacterium]
MEDNNNDIEYNQNNESDSDLVVVSEILPDKIPILPVTKRPIFPGMMFPLTFSGDRIIQLVENVYEGDKQILGVVLVKEKDEQDFMNSELYRVGTVVKIHKLSKINENTIQIIIQGLERFSHISTAWKEPFLTWKVEYHYNEQQKPDDELKAYTMSIMSSLKELYKKDQIVQEQLKMITSNISHDNPGKLLDLVASILNADKEKLQDALETFDLYDRSKKILVLLKEEIELSQLQEEIEKQIEEKVNKRKKEFFLREQLKIIKKELGLEKDDKTAEIEKFEERKKDLKLTKEAAKTINNEIEKLKMLDPSSPTFNVTRSYLDTLTSLPWGKYSEDRLDIQRVREILDEDHYGLQDVKDLILEFIGTIIKRGSVAGSILCLVGPPGVGKTSVGRSIARALNREFFRFSLGGMKDEAEIKGHRRTYIGAMPGKIMQSLQRTGTANPVIMLDEIDKVGKSYQGDPASALLEVLDPEQNVDFRDHYLDVGFDLSNILFITTANQLDTIPRPLLDRMEIIKLSGYILQEKIEIAKQFLIPKQRKKHNLKSTEVNITDKVLEIIADKYAREAGVRGMENQIKKIMRQVTLKMAEGKGNKFSISNRNYKDYLGKPKYTTEKLYEKSFPGVALGLAWTSLGGKTLYIESSATKTGESGYKQTGQLGDVMKESTEIAFSYIRSKLSKRGNHFFENNFIHLHVPAGATKKDGPSAGITMALSLYSLATNKPVRGDIAMTGELTLTGRVLPVGGIKEKTIAARRVDVYEIILPADNEKDFNNLPDYIREGIDVHFVEYFDEVLDIVYG